MNPLPISLTKAEEAMKVALTVAVEAGSRGDVPVGCVILNPEGIVALGGNRREEDKDPTAHAEILALSEAASKLGRWHLEDCVVVVTLEPCPMCTGALINARVGGLVFGAFDDKAGCCGSLYHLPQDGRFNHNFPVVGGVQAGECRALLVDFFSKRRKA